MVGVGIHAHDVHVRLLAVSALFGGSGQYHIFGPCFQVLGSQFVGQEATCTFYYIVCTHFVPGQAGRIFFCRNTDFAAVHYQIPVFFIDFDTAGETAVHRIIFQQISHIVQRQKIIDGNYLDVIPLFCHPQYETPDTSKSVDPDFNHNRFTALSI